MQGMRSTARSSRGVVDTVPTARAHIGGTFNNRTEIRLRTCHQLLLRSGDTPLNFLLQRNVGFAMVFWVMTTE